MGMCMTLLPASPPPTKGTKECSLSTLRLAPGEREDMCTGLVKSSPPAKPGAVGGGDVKQPATSEAAALLLELAASDDLAAFKRAVEEDGHSVDAAALCCVPCPEFRKGSCRNGDACEYAHGVFESWLHPAQYRTRLCKDETGCNRRVCFFAHKPEELRTVNPSVASVNGIASSSPRSSSPGLSSLDVATALMLMQQPGSPMSPSAASSGLGATAAWMNQTGGVMTPPPALQLPSSRLKASLSARDLDFDLELLGLEGYQQKLIDEITKTASPRANWGTNSLAASRISEYSDLLGSVDPSLLTQLQGLSTRQTGAQFQAPSALQKHQSQSLSGYGGNLSSSPATSSFGLDHSMAKAIMNSRASAFAKRSQSFCDRGATAGRQSTLSAMTTAAVAAPSLLSDWGSPDGKLDWGVQGEELNKLRKSASFAFRGAAPATAPTGMNEPDLSWELNKLRKSASFAFRGAAPATAPTGMNEPDLSWVHSLVKDGPAAPPVGRLGAGEQQSGYQLSSGGDLFSPWSEEKIMA
ncbi:hypothetical protein C4D60_Mb06t33540 [Musa balbisiana]|uniref:C3H1-type domain-containing protein n=1 Tax=Musa balbisiana TaxID=52838 RepID=A0A4S8ITU9_MUSBA|nr:hypothetical protein C4D60_Mb06t33540 [Musa balbisiana]